MIQKKEAESEEELQIKTEEDVGEQPTTTSSSARAAICKHNVRIFKFKMKLSELS